MTDESAEEFVARQMNLLRGRCCGLIESWGLEEKRERAMIQTFKSLTYDAQAEVTELIKEFES